jgi:hypothetical protein
MQWSLAAASWRGVHGGVLIPTRVAIRRLPSPLVTTKAQRLANLVRYLLDVARPVSLRLEGEDPDEALQKLGTPGGESPVLLALPSDDRLALLNGAAQRHTWVTAVWRPHRCDYVTGEADAPPHIKSVRPSTRGVRGIDRIRGR